MTFSSPFPEVDIPTASVYDYLFASLSSSSGHDEDPHLDRVALIDAKSGRQTTYREMLARIDSFAGALAARGIGVGDVVGLLAPNSSAFAVAFHGILRAGATATTINALFTAKDIAKQLTDSQARMLITVTALFPRPPTARPRRASPMTISWCSTVRVDTDQASAPAIPMPLTCWRKEREPLRHR